MTYEFAVVRKNNLVEFDPFSKQGDPIKYWAKTAKPGQINKTMQGEWVICLQVEEFGSFPND